MQELIPTNEDRAHGDFDNSYKLNHDLYRHFFLTHYNLWQAWDDFYSPI